MSTRRRDAARRLAPLGYGFSLLFAFASCRSTSTAPPQHPNAGAVELEPLRSEAHPPRKDEGPETAQTHVVGTVARQTIGPFLARAHGGQEALAAWAVPSDTGVEDQIVVVPLGPDGAALASPRVVAAAPRETTALVVRPAGTASDGWLVAFSAILDRGESIAIVSVTPAGEPRGAPLDLERTNDHVAWFDLVPTGTGALCVWAEETGSGDGNVLTAAVDRQGRPRGVPVRVAQGISGWAVAPAKEGAAVALITRDSGPKGSGAGALSWLRLDAAGRAAGAPVPIGRTPTVSGDVDMVATGAGWLLAWTDRTGEDAQVALAFVDADQHVMGPVRALDALGGSSLVALAAGPSGSALAWRDPHGEKPVSGELHLARVSSQGALTAQEATTLQIASQTTPPELVATDDGFAVLAASPQCTAGETPGRCSGPPLTAFVRLDGRLAPNQDEPMVVGRGDEARAVALAWGLDCSGQRCLALAAPGEVPTPIYSVDLARRASSFPAPVVPPPPPGVPRASGLITLASGRAYTDLAAAPVGDVTLVATLADSTTPGAADARRRTGATITVRAFDDDGQPIGPAFSIASAALPVGRVALAAAPRRNDSTAPAAAAAYVTVDRGDPQVHVVRLDANGRPSRDVQLTTAVGDASDVALAWAGDGWLVAWVDGRDGNGEVYAAKVSPDLDHVGPGQRITNAPGDAADVALAVAGDKAFVAWSDPRESPAEGLSDVHATTLRTRDGARSSDDVRVLATAPHSRSPALVPTRGGALVAWIEAPPLGIDANGVVMLARLDDEAHVVGTPGPVALAGEGRPVAIALAAAADGGAHAAIARSARGRTTIDALSFAADGTVRAPPWRLLALNAPPSFDVVLAFAGHGLVYDDTGAAPDDHRVRRARIDWR